jgi:hypothetical protein
MNNNSRIDESMDKSFWKQFLKTTVVPTIYVADSEIQPEGRCISERLEKIGRLKTTRG